MSSVELTCRVRIKAAKLGDRQERQCLVRVGRSARARLDRASPGSAGPSAAGRGPAPARMPGRGGRRSATSTLRRASNDGGSAGRAPAVSLRSSSVSSSPAIHSACWIISALTLPASTACAARARRNVSEPTPRAARALSTARRPSGSLPGRARESSQREWTPDFVDIMVHK